jgi:type I restriction enzyme M protein
MILHGFDTPTTIRRANTLTRPLRDYGPADRVDVVVTNPPFGGIEEPGVEANFPRNIRTRETADLFLALIIRLLKPGGRAGMILPDGTLFGEGVKTRLKEQLLTECDLHTIVRIPGTAFAPYTTIATNLLFFTKGTPTKHVWFYEHRIPSNMKAYSKTKPIQFEEFEAVKAWWSHRTEGGAAWRVSIEDIRDRQFDLDIKNPYREEEADSSPSELLAAFHSHKEEVSKAVAAIRDALSEIVSEHAD